MVSSNVTTQSEQEHVVGVSGGKDSTALALRLQELHPDRNFVFLITPTGDELPDMIEHWKSIETLLGQPLTHVANRSLAFWMDEYKALPNFRQRWCTRLIKIEPTVIYLKQSYMTTGQKPVLYVGLRADEPERQGLYSADVETRFPLREWGWGITEVTTYLRDRGVRIPERTDCARCYAQRLIDWKRLLARYPDIYAAAEEDEERYGHTFRSPQRDNWPAGLKELRAEFEQGRKLRGEATYRERLRLADEGQDDDFAACRVCSL